MKFYRFDRGTAQPLSIPGSLKAYLARGVRTTAPSQISCFHLEPGGRIGYHRAPTSRLLLVVQGEGWVRAGDGDLVAVAAGDAVFWEEGEWHEIGSGSGLMLIAVESGTLDPGEFMPAGGGCLAAIH